MRSDRDASPTTACHSVMRVTGWPCCFVMADECKENNRDTIKTLDRNVRFGRRLHDCNTNFAQEGPVSPLGRYARGLAEPGTFWLDTNDDREIIRYTTSRDVRLCLPRPEGVGSADRGFPLIVTWDQTNKVTLQPGNCLYFDAKRVSVKPATALPSGVTLEGQVDAAWALRSD